MIRLTTRETEVMQGVCDGLTNREIGEKLGLSHRTVQIHRKSAIGALGGKNTAHAAVIFDRERRKPLPKTPLEGLNVLVSQLRAFYLSHHANAPIAIVLDDRHSLDFMRSISFEANGWTDIHAVKTMSLAGVKFRFETPE